MITDERQNELLDLYLGTMGIIKWRMKAIADIRNKVKTTSFANTNTEFCILQIRKILESIAFASLVSNADVYNEKLGNVYKMRNAKKILEDIERINPDFYPKPILIDPADKYNLLEYPDLFLTREQFIIVYDKCGKHLHEMSPFLSEKKEAEVYSELHEVICTWEQLIINLLHTHLIQLYDNDHAFFIKTGGFVANTEIIGWKVVRCNDSD